MITLERAKGIAVEGDIKENKTQNSPELKVLKKCEPIRTTPPETKKYHVPA